jgi:hydrogenase maturation protease
MKILIYGYGNPGRQDDGLGILFSEAIEKWAKKDGIKGVTCDSNYQLNAEDALAMSKNDIVIFADAAKNKIKDIEFKKVKSGETISFSTHSMPPESVLALCIELYKKQPETYIMQIKGYEWGINGTVTKKAIENLHKSVKFIKKFISQQ